MSIRCKLGIHTREEEHFLEPRPGPAPRPTVHAVCQRCRDGDPFVDMEREMDKFDL